MRLIACALTGLLLAGCTSTDPYYDHNGDLLGESQQAGSLAEEIRRSQRDGCLAGGNASKPGCSRERERLADLISPPQLPEGVEIRQQPPQSETPDYD